MEKNIKSHNAEIKHEFSLWIAEVTKLHCKDEINRSRCIEVK
jgi:hypothetical protein